MQKLCVLQFFILNSCYHCVINFEECLPKVNTVSCIKQEIVLRRNMFLILERSFLALDWDPELKKRYFDDSAAEVSCLCCSPFQHQ